jgi:NADH:ubiquinone oxidoreductase subunit 6 (subunit J)
MAGIVFVGFAFLIVYVGAVAILFLFVIMLLNAKSLTARQLLILHTSQYLALLGANLLLHETYITALRALDRTLTADHLRLISLEGNSGEAVAFYIRFIAADINALTGLYTIHTPLFLITTAILLVSLIGAIILATMTTERPISASDLLVYANRLVSKSPRAVAVALAPAITVGVCAAASVAGGCTATEVFESVGILLMSFFEPKDRKNRTILQAASARVSDSFLIARQRKTKLLLTARFARWTTTAKNNVRLHRSRYSWAATNHFSRHIFARVYIVRPQKYEHYDYYNPGRWRLRKKKFRALWRRRRAVKAMRHQIAISSLAVRLRARVLVRSMRRALRLRGRVRRRAFRRLALRAILHKKGWNSCTTQMAPKKYTPKRLTSARVRAVYASLYRLRGKF